MVDGRIVKIANLLLEYSTEVRSDDKVLIYADLAAKDLALEIYKNALIKGAYPWIRVEIPGRQYMFYKYAQDKHIQFFPEIDMFEIKNTDVYIALRAPLNVKELSSIDPSKISMRMKVLKPIFDWRVEKTRWVIFYCPTEGLAQEAGMSLQEFEDFVFNACLIDWRKTSMELHKIKDRLNRTDKVRIIGSNTDIEFSVKNRSAVVADGKRNMPDGEVFTSVIEDSVNGVIEFDIPAVFYGNIVEDIHLKFKDGVVTECKARFNEVFLKKMLNTDEGARRIGEFGIGLNYNITRSVKEILFDEKIGGTIHLALGRGYSETLSRNESAIHWDMIKDLRVNGEIYFDNELVMKDGKWFIL
ncbi:MAG: aminopeptidase [Candidatus Methanomethylicia archaeon]